MMSLSKPQARKLALLSQGLPPKSPKSHSPAHTLNVMEQIGYVQIDTISVVQRAHHHVLWSRNPKYRPEHLDKLIADKKVVEYWSHAASFLPMKNYRYTLLRKVAIKSGEQAHWYKKDHKLMNHVITRIQEEGPLLAKDFESKGTKINGWGAKPAKRALEYLFMQGDLMIPERRGFQKVYDLTERVLPSDIDVSVPSPQEHARFLVLNYLKAHGLGTIPEFVYLLKNVKTEVTSAIQQLNEEGVIVEVDVEGSSFWVLSESLSLLDARLNRKQAKILSPFDNLLIQRKRASTLFDFDYLIECYVPEGKRQYGYFCLPILWNGSLVARADCKVDKKTATLNVLHLFLESSLKKKADFLEALEQELASFSAFNQCEHFKICKVSECR
ncbi:winged helix-turn-helix domain-containing protein [Vibrio nigripulchritudo]|uniref:winged helix-turn-helix domain-containing protein n=1 Tax=Vibrio nigripulchritudo TaxID=28173 RepID=UPI00190E3257|nr:crosslink repair DNA glycosylase YcaQ family protein [Vibrio nigripulchritudo]